MPGTCWSWFSSCSGLPPWRNICSLDRRSFGKRINPLRRAPYVDTAVSRDRCQTITFTENLNVRLSCEHLTHSTYRAPRSAVQPVPFRDAELNDIPKQAKRSEVLNHSPAASSSAATRPRRARRKSPSSGPAAAAVDVIGQVGTSVMVMPSLIVPQDPAEGRARGNPAQACAGGMTPLTITSIFCGSAA
jgi:hypothetical protein